MSHKLEDLLSQISFKHAQSSMFMLLQNCYHLTSDPQKDFIYPVTTKMDEITKKILYYTFQAPSTLTEDEQKTIGEDLSALRNQVAEIAREVSAYNQKTSMALSIYIAGCNSSDQPLQSFNISDYIFELCHKYINVITPEPITNVYQELHQSFNIGKLLSYLPIKMTKEKYYDYVKKSLDLLFKDMSSQSINDMVPLLKLKFHYTKTEEVYFPQAETDVTELINRAEQVKNIDEADELSSDIEIFQEWLYQILNLLDLQYESLCFLSLVKTISSDSEIYFEENILYKDIFFTVKESLFNGDRMLFEENAMSTLEEYSEACIDEIKIIDESITKKLTSSKPTTETESLLLNLLQIIQNLYFSSLHSSIYYLRTDSKSDDEDNSACKNEAVLSILAYIKDQLSQFPTKQQKFLRELYFDVIPSPFSAEEFFEYALLSLNTCSSSRQKTALDLIFDEFSRTNLDMQQEHNCDGLHEHHCNCDHSH